MSLEILNNNLSNSKVLSFDEIGKGFSDQMKSSSGLSVISNSDKSGYKADNLIYLTFLIDDIRSNYLNLKHHQMVYEFKRYISNLEQTYILDDNKNHIGVSAKIYLKDGSVKLHPFGMDRPYMEVFFDTNKKLSYALTFRFEDSMQTAIELKTNSFKEYRNLLLYLGYGDIEKDKQSSAFFIREFTRFLNSSNSSDDLYTLYRDIPLSFTSKIQLTTEKVINHLKILAERDDSGFFSWTEDTSSLLVKVLGMFRKPQEVTDYFWKAPKLLTRIYDNLDGFSEPFGLRMSNRIIFTSVLNEFAKRSKIDKSRISTNTLKSGNGYFVESNILELNDTLNTIKGILSFDWDFDYKDAIFLQQKQTVTQTVEQNETDEFGKGGSTVEETRTITEDIDPGYLYHPMHLVHFLDEGEKKANLVTALFIKALADEKEWEQVMRNIRIGGDILAIITGLLTLGSTSVLAIADIGLATIDLTLMDEDIKAWLSQSPEGKWFVENWDLIYGLVGAGIISAVMIDGILTNGPTLIQKIKNLKNIKSNYRIFVQELEKLVTELEAYRAANPVDNVIEEVIINASKDSVLKKLIKKFSSSDLALNNVIKDLTKKGISVRKSSENVFEIIYKGEVIRIGNESETGSFLRKIYNSNSKKSEELLEKLLNEVNQNSRKRNIVDSDGLRGSKALTTLQKKEIFDYAKLYFTENADELIQFADELSTNNTGYMALMDVLYINTDIMPGILKTANSRLSWKAAIAHELEGHRFAAIKGKTFYDPKISLQANDLLEEIQASVRSSKLGKDLSALERDDLLQDAIQRYEKYNSFLVGTKYEGLTFEKIIKEIWILKQ